MLLQRESKCALCGVYNPRLLIVSHIKPWSTSTNDERLDVHNGLLLCSNHDALFDKKLISFTDNRGIKNSKNGI
ncbi:HNH endonuclease [Planococcus donghaensis]|uniref:HNH endonuclease n=1 Tax=Planococcus donghaensis TaxID=414778 RepID=UPI001ED8C0CD|nr:HNH endonuclease signature motif containing protein [Planococcus donghaensis]